MNRHSLAHLLEWKAREGRRPMLLRGARQVGKSYLADAFAKASGLDPISFDFELDPSLGTLFEATSADSLLRDLSARARRNVVPGQSLLILDEIQASPRAFLMLRYLYEWFPGLHVLAAGSLLELALSHRRVSVPVGRIEYLHLGPMTFDEYVDASAGPALGEVLRGFGIGTRIPEAIHRQLMDLLREYMVVGGMPAAVAAWLKGRSLSELDRIKRGLLRSLEDDFGKYGGRADLERLRKVFRALPRLVGTLMKYSHLDPDDRAAPLRAALDLLVLARIAARVPASDATGVPLGAMLQERHFKTLLVDVGLLVTACGLDAGAVLAEPNPILINAGAVAEQLVGQHLLATLPSEAEPEVHFWARAARTSNAEVDFVISSGSRIVPVEVKAGKSGSLRSMQVFLRDHGCGVGIRLNADPPSLLDVEHGLPTGERVAFRLLSLPLYLAGQVRRLADELSGT